MYELRLNFIHLFMLCIDINMKSFNTSIVLWYKPCKIGRDTYFKKHFIVFDILRNNVAGLMQLYILNMSIIEKLKYRA